MSERPWPAVITDLGDRIAALAPAEAGDLTLYLAQAHNLRAVLEAAAPPPTFAVVLDEYDPACKVRVIKVVWDLTNWGLREARDFVEGPLGVVLDQVGHVAAEDARTRLEAAGARVTLRPGTGAVLTVWLEGFDRGQIIPVIKTVRELTGLGLAQAKRLVESCPAVVRAGLPVAEAEAVRARLEAVGATVSLR
jgi:large subunit ribosomal protein L7/L12